MRIFSLLFCLLLAFSLSAQKNYQPKGGNYRGKGGKIRKASTHLKRNPTDVFPLDLEYNLNGWFGSLGATYMVPWREGDGGDGTRSVLIDSITLKETTFEQQGRYSSSPRGNIGAYVDLGYFHSFQRPLWSIFHFYEVGLSYRWYKGKEKFSGILKNDVIDSLNQIVSSTSENQEYTYTYSDHVGSLVAKITNHWHFSRYGFLQNSIGINAHYYFLNTRSSTNAFPGYNPEFPSDFQAQLNYRLGVGWKASPTLLIVPSIELPIMSLYPFDNFQSSLTYFSSRTIPIVVSIRFMLLRRLKEDCLVPNYDGPANFE